jgi:uncharacterized protein (TIGR02452 family)
MNKNYAAEIQHSIEQSTIYGGNNNIPSENKTDKKPNILFLNTDSVNAILQTKNLYPNKHIAVLNFASYKHPGGMFLKGSSAQEEMLCHSSFLYNVLSSLPDYYQYNNQHKNRALYTNRAVYSPDIVFTTNNQRITCDVLTCACPNKTTAIKYQMATEGENNKTAKERIQFIKNILEEKQIDCFITGAFGCGVFGQNPELIAHYTKEIFATTNVPNIIIAVPGNDKNAKIFQKVFSENK